MTDQDELVDDLRRRIADPGAYLPRIPDTAVNPGETVGNWAARAVAAGLEDGTLGVRMCDALCRDVETDRDRLAAERTQLVLELGNMRGIAQGNKRHVADLTAILERVEKLTVNTDGDDLDDSAEIPVGEIRRALHEPIPGVTAPVPGSSHARKSPDGDCVYVDVRDGQMTVTQTTGRPLALAVNGEWVTVPDRERTTVELTSSVSPLPVGVEYAYAEGYREAAARLRDDERYLTWWASRPVIDAAERYWNAGPRGHLADYLEAVGPDGIDVETGRWPAREQAVIRAAVAWRAQFEKPADTKLPRMRALIEAVDALPRGADPA